MTGDMVQPPARTAHLSDDTGRQALPPMSRKKRFLTLAVLTIVTTFSAIDRQIMNILVEPIRAEMHLSDTQIGLLTGIAFALVNMTAAIPAARLADNWSRRNVIAMALSFWSLLTILCGAAGNFVQLFAARIGVGLGEAGGNAPTFAVVGDLFERQHRATAMTVVMLSPAIGMAIGLGWGGYAAQHYGWRTALVVVGVAGLMIGPLTFLGIPEVPKGLSDRASSRGRASLVDVLRALKETPTAALMLGATALNVIFFTGMAVWLPAFLTRSHHLAQADIGGMLGLALGGGSLLGNLCGGPLVDALGRRNMRHQLLVPTITTPVAASLAIAALLLPTRYVFFCVAGQAFIGALFGGAMIAVMLTLAPVGGRATAVAVMSFVISGVAMGLGPQMIGIVSDALKPGFATESLRMALLSTSVLAVPATLLYALASARYVSDLAKVDARITAERQT